ncbi:MAG: hypothetical protein AAGK32_02310 [Actinomycetota bacterium]
METRAARWIPLLAAAVVVGAVVAPMFRSPAPDGFPLSTYPMFARDRGDSAWVDTAIGRTDDGDAVRLTTELISGNDEPVLASATVTRAIRSGATADLCEEIAARVQADGGDGIATVEVVGELHDLDRFEPDEPIERRVLAECGV